MSTFGKATEDEQTHPELLVGGGRLESVVPLEEEEEETELERIGGGGGAQEMSSQAKKKAAPETDDATHKVGTFTSFPWTAKTMAHDPALKKKPLTSGLKAQQLSTKEQFNMGGVYLKAAKNNGNFGVGIKIDGVNGQSLNHYTDEVGQTYAYPLLAGEAVNYGQLNRGKGLKLGGHGLDAHGQVNIEMSGQPLESFATPTTDGQHMIVDLNLASHAKNAQPGAVESLSPLGQVVVANSRAALAQHPIVRSIVGNALDPTSPVDKKTPSIFQTYQVAPKAFAESPAELQVKIDKPSFDQMLKLYKDKVATKVAKTSADDYTVSIVRLNHKPGTSKPFGDIAGEHGVTPRDVDIASSGAVTSGVTVVLNHDIHHNGKPYESSSSSSSSSASTSTSGESKTK